ncbi:carboxyl-terminal peptidase [Cinnamomum micranthum f. kanehirae]|uniref:Carboxyl-terminal peptidase n=1 Tax=Cinnamomum micranthum f. kanehirae TaxID=337451 RepID=A0A3S3M9U0_9MAGN|nr:carboxyl-terminal peptidase [Cinnamomum micranthum f. kanehirae]
MVMEGENHGAEASINAWSVHVEPFESSTASVYVRKKDTSEFVNSGWIISQNIMGDNKTRFYALWEADGDGCYNLVCPGFVQISHRFGFGAIITPLSTYDGVQTWITLRISMVGSHSLSTILFLICAYHVKLFACLLEQDPADGHWWLVLLGESVGYWPSSLFKKMVVSADLIEWSGEVVNTRPGGQHTSTQMGSGHFSNEGFKKAAFFDDCVFLVEHDDARKPSNAIVSATSPKCYDVSETSKGRDRGLFFYYGGPGGPSCDN